MDGYIEYQRREYCREIRCPRQEELESKPAGSNEYEVIRALCKGECLHTTYEFHHWLIEKGYLIIRPEK